MKHLPFKTILFGLISTILVLLVVALVMELGFRIHDGLTPEPALHPIYGIHEPDEHWGWKMRANYLLADTIYEDDGTPVPLIHQTDSSGFRTALEALPGAPRILVLGDSYTQALEVSNGEIYTDVLHDNLGASVYAYGCGGYGTLQQLMVLGQHLDRIKPDWVILQFCTNDFVDNHLELGRKCYSYRIGKCRPYFRKNGKIIYRNQDLPEQVKEWTHLGYFLTHRWHLLRQNMGWEEADAGELMPQLGLAYTPYRESIELTAMLLDSLRNRLSSETQLLTFCSDSWNPYYQDFMQICDSLNIPHLPQIPMAILDAKRAKEPIFSADQWHWNAQGHQLVASVLAAEIRERSPDDFRLSAHKK